MKLINLLLGKKPLNTLAFSAAAMAVHSALIALEVHLESKGDKRAQVLVRELHRALETMWNNFAPALGVGGVAAFSGGGPKPPAAD